MARPRKKTVARDANGKSRGERPDEVRSVVVAQRVRAGAPPKSATDPMWGWTVGIMRAKREISEAQFNAAVWYCGVIYRYCGLRGLPLPLPKSPSLMLVGGTSLRDDPDPETLIRSKRAHSAARMALAKCGMAIGAGSRVNKIVFEACIENRDIATIYDADRHYLRAGLHALHRIVD